MNTNFVTEHITSWLKSYADKVNIKGFVIGISGGIDSSVTSTLCAKTGLEVLCLEMPINQSPSHVTRANEQIEFLKNSYKNVQSLRVDLTPVFKVFKSQILSLIHT